MNVEADHSGDLSPALWLLLLVIGQLIHVREHIKSEIVELANALAGANLRAGPGVEFRRKWRWQCTCSLAIGPLPAIRLVSALALASSCAPINCALWPRARLFRWPITGGEY